MFLNRLEELVINKDENSNSAQFVVGPLDAGFGITLGNALRRVLLSSLSGAAVTAVKIDGVLHSFSTVSGVKEDMVEIILNIQSIVLKILAGEKLSLNLEVKGPCVVTAGMLSNNNPNIRILNPDHVICHVSGATSLKMEVYCQTGKGYMPSVVKPNVNLPVGMIAVDALFTPIKNVSYKVENTRVGEMTNYDRLLLNVETNGAISPELAVSMASKLLQEKFNLFISCDVNALESSDDVVSDSDTYEDLFQEIIFRKLCSLGLSVRSYNCLKNDNMVYVGDLLQKDQDELLRLHNFGNKSLDEILVIIESLNKELAAVGGAQELRLGMKIDDWDTMFKNKKS